MGMLTGLAMVLAVQGAAAQRLPAGAGAAAFQRLKGLVGEWRGWRPDGREVRVTYRLSALGSVIVETWTLGPQVESLTVYHMDGGDLMATHFCPQGNQPRLRMKRSAAGRFDFTFQDATGVQPGQGVQKEFWVAIGPGGTMTRSETYVQNGAPESETITYERVKG